jgi:hypothetical protein
VFEEWPLFTADGVGRVPRLTAFYLPGHRQGVGLGTSLVRGLADLWRRRQVLEIHASAATDAGDAALGAWGFDSVESRPGQAPRRRLIL